MMDIKAITEVLYVFQKKITFVIVFFVSATLLFAADPERYVQDGEVSQGSEKDTIDDLNVTKVKIFVAKGATIINVDSIKGNLSITYEKTLENTTKNKIAKKSFRLEAKKIAQEYVKAPAKQLKVKLSASIPHSLLALSLYIGNNFVIPSSQTQIKAICYDGNYKNTFFTIPKAIRINFDFVNAFVIEYHSGYFFSRPPPSIS
ncbi:hypothetical protein J2X97_002221 [Epilithonimonas hungarica]|uniref:hypothetical protein n=1 Tax=Epilithonimonas hungarica TaxID=454006 RepID=UPI00277EC432|nr:hypothetical protein [Epilithonimonas hungarica]MDP9956562.1 hypothetical protein [Epilithonimonas hungarica]